MKILGASWYTPMGSSIPIGIILVEMTKAECQEYCIPDGNTNGNRAAYIGIAKLGNSEQEDAEHIVKTGAKFPLSSAEQLFGLFE